MRLALAVLERGDARSAEDLLRAALSLESTAGESTAQSPPTAAPELARVATMARALDASPRTVRRWIRSGRIPSDAVLGNGRGLRLDSRRVLSAFRADALDAEELGAAHVMRRAGCGR